MLSVSARFVPRSDLGRFVDIHISPAVYAAVQASCEEVQAVAQALCPVDTGALQASITIDPLEETGKSVVGRVGPHTDYAEYVEYGTGRRGAESPGAGAGPYKSDWAGQAAQPYMRPALDETRPKVLEVFRNNIAEALA
jgi:HK97 gp10 family phage protein